ncbi:MAG TPA: hypothetical protein VF534_30075 [Paraburkholderia sp.]
MPSSNPQQTPTLAAQPAAANSGFAAPLVSFRTVALSLLVDRALSA